MCPRGAGADSGVLVWTQTGDNSGSVVQRVKDVTVPKMNFLLARRLDNVPQADHDDNDDGHYHQQQFVDSWRQ